MMVLPNYLDATTIAMNKPDNVNRKRQGQDYTKSKEH